MINSFRFSSSDYVRKLVGPDENSRPAWLRKRLWILEYGRFVGPLVAALALLTDGNRAWAGGILVCAGLGLVIVLVDLVTYRPSLLAFLGGSADQSKDTLERLASDRPVLKQKLNELTVSPPAKWAEVVEVHNSLLYLISDDLVSPEKARRRMVLRLATATASLICSLSAVAYGLNSLSEGRTLNVSVAQNASASEPGAAEVLSFAATNFFTMGTGAVSVAPSGTGYFYQIVDIASLFTVVYFVISFALGSYLQVERTLDSAVHEYVLSASEV